jgi:hypothetical protein
MAIRLFYCWQSYKWDQGNSQQHVLAQYRLASHGPARLVLQVETGPAKDGSSGTWPEQRLANLLPATSQPLLTVGSR